MLHSQTNALPLAAQYVHALSFHHMQAQSLAIAVAAAPWAEPFAAMGTCALELGQADAALVSAECSATLTAQGFQPVRNHLGARLGVVSPAGVGVWMCRRELSYAKKKSLAAALEAMVEAYAGSARLHLRNQER